MRDEHIQYQQQLSDIQRKGQEDILVKEELAKKNVMDRLKERRKALMRREVRATHCLFVSIAFSSFPKCVSQLFTGAFDAARSLTTKQDSSSIPSFRTSVAESSRSKESRSEGMINIYFNTTVRQVVSVIFLMVRLIAFLFFKTNHSSRRVVLLTII